MVDRTQPILEAKRAELFGHPRGLFFLFSTELWERFSFYGMRSLLVLYMTKYLLLPEHSGAVIGLDGVRRALEAVFGPLPVQPLASQLWGFYTALVYFTPIFGGLLADRVLGRRKTVVIGAVLMAIGHFMMTVEPLFLFALLFLIVGSGAFKPNISTQVGGLYAPGDHRRDRAYSIFYVGINIGAFLAPLVCGTLGEEVGWHYGFAAAGIGMCIGLCIYLYALPMLPADNFPSTSAASDHPPLQGEGRTAQKRVHARLRRAMGGPGWGDGGAVSFRITLPACLRLGAQAVNLPPPGGGEKDAAPTEQIKALTRSERRAVIALLVLFVPNTLFWGAYEQISNTIVLWADANTDRSIHLFGLTGQIPTTSFLAFNPFMIFAFTPFVVALWSCVPGAEKNRRIISKMALGCLGLTLAYLLMAFAAFYSGGVNASWLWLFWFFVVITLGELYLSPVGLSFCGDQPGAGAACSRC